MVTYRAFIILETGDVDGVLDMMRRLAEESGGYVAGSTRSGLGMEGRAEITLRVPRTGFHAVVEEVEEYGRVLEEKTSSEDFTERFIDLKARLGNLQRQEGRLQGIPDLAETVKEVLEVEGELESLQGQITYLERSVEIAVITVRLVEPPPPGPHRGSRLLLV